MNNFIKKYAEPIILFVVIGVIAFISYFLIDKDLGKVFGVSGFFVWFLREYSRQLLSKDLEKFKAELQKESIKFKIRYEKLHSERAEIIKEVYKNIQRTYAALCQYFLRDFSLLHMDLQRYGEINEGIINELQSCTNYFVENRIYFEEELARKIDQLIFNYTEIKIIIENNRKNDSKIVEGNSLNLGELILKENRDKEIWERINKQLPSITSEIEHRFRVIIGISNLDGTDQNATN